ncbi:hypothetical protein SRABI27_03709 [Pedobacter sp. Bi27]|uniref:hypothetical protein n=1 Tax=Pedobacter sp. Bi27 TaxID=2822351 RepID=UPI001DED33E6|nr:hypothetical protein [Pedobacter sp. Bi27]CAH0278672.1 hypothetical protein SRABI27_03709 [Pedobacter sp. Bi27]
MKIILEDLTERMESLLKKVSIIEKKLEMKNSRRLTGTVLELPLNDLLAFKIELEEIRHSLASLNQQVNEITIFETLKQIEATTNEIKESSGFLKNIFVREKVKSMKEKVPKQDAVNDFIKKYMNSMK